MSKKINALDRRGQLQVMYSDEDRGVFLGYNQSFDEIFLEYGNKIYTLAGADVDLSKQYNAKGVCDLYDSIAGGEIDPLATYTSTDPMIRQKEYDRRHGLMNKTIRVERALNQQFIDKCEKLGISQQDALNDIIRDFVTTY